MRLDTGVPSGVPHAALRDTKLGGYDVPQVAYHESWSYLSYAKVSYI